MDFILKIIAVGFLIFMLVLLWPAYRYWNEHKIKALPGDWLAVFLALGAVVLFVILLITVRKF